MPEKDRRAETVSAEIQEAVRDILAAARAARLYPPNNPLHSQTIAKSHRAIENCLRHASRFSLIVQKTGLFCCDLPVDRDSGFSRGIASDLFVRGVREISFLPGLTEAELRDFYSVIALPAEDLRMKGSVASLLWERGSAHINVREAGLEDVLRASADAGPGTAPPVLMAEDRDDLGEKLKGKEIDLAGRKVLLAEIVRDAAAFGALALDLALMGGTDRPPEDRLFDIYRHAGREALRQPPELAEPLFAALARSLFSMDREWRDKLISGRLYPEFDRIAFQERAEDIHEQVPHDLHEILSARFSRSWAMPQIAALLRTAASAAPPSAPQQSVTPLPADLPALARELSGYGPEEMESLKTLVESGRENDTLAATVATLIQILPAVQRALPAGAPEAAATAFSRVVGILEDAFLLLFERKDYRFAAVVLRAFRMPADPPFRQRLTEAVKKAGESRRIHALVHALRPLPKDSPEHEAIISCLSLLDREATPVLLEMLAEEEDRSIRKVLVHVLMGLGKNQIALLGERLSDERWYFVRNIVNILGESRKEEAIDYLAEVANHRNFQIRQEVVRALVAIGGKRAAGLLTRFLTDKDIDIRFMAIRGLGSLPATGEREEQALIAQIRGGRLRRPSPELRLEAVASLGKIGGSRAARFLRDLARVRWWKPKKPQLAIASAARQAAAEIERRIGNAGRP